MQKTKDPYPSKFKRPIHFQSTKIFIFFSHFPLQQKRFKLNHASYGRDQAYSRWNSFCSARVCPFLLLLLLLLCELSLPGLLFLCVPFGKQPLCCGDRFKTSPLKTLQLFQLYFFSQEYSLFVGDLSDDVDDLKLYAAFKRYPSLKTAKGTDAMLVLHFKGCYKKYLKVEILLHPLIKKYLNIKEILET